MRKNADKLKERIIKRKRYKIGLLFEIAVFFLVGMSITGYLSSMVLNRIADRSVQIEKEILSEGIAKDVKKSIKNYDCYDWVINYWIDHMGELDLEYDKSVDTYFKEKDFLDKYPELIFDRANDAQLAALPPEDQKAFAEIIFNRLLLRMNDIKASYDVRYVYLFYTEGDASTMTNLISASDSTMKRGNEKGTAFLMGTTITNNPDEQKAFKQIKVGKDHLVVTNDNVNRYHFFSTISRKNLIIGVSFDISLIRGEVERNMIIYIAIFVFFQLLLSAVCLFLIYIFALRPLSVVKENMDTYKDTKESEEVLKRLGKIKSRNEIGALANGFGEMITEIDDYVDEIKTITAENERIIAELDIAERIQADMLPRSFPAFPNNPEIDVYATMDPARQVGGDFYDFFMPDENHVALVVADVTGKGVPAALFMVVSRTLLKNRIKMGGRPAEILTDVNTLLCEGNESNLFVTVWMAIIDIRTGEGIAANAGHEHPVIRRAGGRYELVKYNHSMVVGVMPGLKYTDHTFKLEAGDRIFSYSDGVPEATNEDKELYGTDRMLDALNKNHTDDLEKLLKSLRSDIDEFVGDAEQFDDITMLAFDFHSTKIEN
ncbi:MAG: PP2C family protein-serine/threonine phosphatase [Eubacterium sp.]|nr:PP2C family protein-serine/threonine phosphatase [Eubacterium sp.]